MSVHQALDLIQKHFPSLSSRQMEQLQLYWEAMKEWNEKVNLVSRKDMDAFEEHHLLHSLAIAHCYSFLPKTRILDVGTGGGLPGIPLAIAFPEVEILMVDSIGKKIQVVTDCIHRLKLDNARARQCRMESIEEKVDFVTNRAVAPLPDLYRWTRKLFRKESKHPFANGIIGLKGNIVEQEAKSLKGELHTHLITDFFPYEFFTDKVVYHFTCAAYR